MRVIDRIITGIVTFIHSIAWGMRSADREIMEASSISMEPDSSVEQSLIQQNVMNDLLREEETERVKELRDKYYRVIIKTKEFRPNLTIVDDGNGNFHFDVGETERVSISESKKKHPKIEDNEKDFILIQDQYTIEPSFEEQIRDFTGNQVNLSKQINISYSDKIVEFQPSRFLKRLVVRKGRGKRHELSLYFSMQGDFNDGAYYIFFKRLEEELLSGGTEYDFLHPTKIEFTTYNAVGVYDLLQYEYEKISYKGITKFENSYVLHYTAFPSKNGKCISDKFKTNELDKKYEDMVPKLKDIPIDAAVRKIEKSGA